MMEAFHEAQNVRMPRACKRGKPSQAEPQKACASKRGRRSKPISLRELLQSSAYDTPASTSSMMASYAMPQQGTAQQQFQQAQFAAAYSQHDPRLQRAADRQHNYYTRAQTVQEQAAYLPTQQNMALSASNQVLYPNISTATYTVPEQLPELTSMSGQSSFPYNTRSAVNHAMQTGVHSMPNMHQLNMSRENRTPGNVTSNNNALQTGTASTIVSQPVVYLNQCSQIPATVHSKNTEQMSSPAPAAGPESISYMNRTSRTPVTALNRTIEQMSPPASASGSEQISYMNRVSRTPAKAHCRNAEQVNSPASAAGAEFMSHTNVAGRTPVTAHMGSSAPAHSRNSQQMSTPAPAHSRNIEQMNSPVNAAGVESMSNMNRASRTPLPAHSGNTPQFNFLAPVMRSDCLPYATRSTRVPVTAHYRSSYTTPTAGPGSMAYMNSPTRTPAPAHNVTAQQFRYYSLRPRPIRKDNKQGQTEFTMTEEEAKLIKLLQNKKMNVNHIKTEVKGKELNVTFYEKPIRTDVISCIEPSSNTLKQSLLKLFHLREMLSVASNDNNALPANENDANINNEAVPALVQLQNVEDPRYEAVSPAETNNLNAISAENPFEQPQMPQQHNMSPNQVGNQGFPIPTIYNQNFSNFRRFNPHFPGMPQSIRGPNFNIPLNFPPNFSFPAYLAEHFFRGNPQSVNNFDMSGWY